MTSQRRHNNSANKSDDVITTLVFKTLRPRPLRWLERRRRRRQTRRTLYWCIVATGGEGVKSILGLLSDATAAVSQFVPGDLLVQPLPRSSNNGSLDTHTHTQHDAYRSNACVLCGNNDATFSATGSLQCVTHFFSSQHIPSKKKKKKTPKVCLCRGRGKRNNTHWWGRLSFSGNAAQRTKGPRASIHRHSFLFLYIRKTLLGAGKESKSQRRWKKKKKTSRSLSCGEPVSCLSSVPPRRNQRRRRSRKKSTDA